MIESSRQHTSSTYHPGTALRNLRKSRGWTLADASKRTGLPVSTLSKIENNKISLNYDKLSRLCQALEMDIAEFFAVDSAAQPAVVSGRRSITRANEGKAINTPSYFHLYPAADLLNKRLIPIIAELHAQTLEEFGDLVRHAGEEYTFVLEGSVEMHTDMYGPVILNTGDSIYFDSGMGHAYLAVGPGPCRVLSICSTSEEQLMDQLYSGKNKDMPAKAPVVKLKTGKAAPSKKSPGRATPGRK